VYLSAVWTWLYDPAVALLGLLSSLITIGQVSASVVGYLKDKMPKEGKRRRQFYTGVALIGLATAIGVTLFAWSAILVAVARIGDHGMGGMADAVAATGIGVAAAAILLHDAQECRFSSLPILILVVALASQITLYLSAHHRLWGPLPSIVATAVVEAAAQILLIGYALRRAKESASKMSAHDHATA
jgi:hypothetical protein